MFAKITLFIPTFCCMLPKITLIPTFYCMFVKTTIIPTFCRMFAKITSILEVLIRTHICPFHSSFACRQPVRGAHEKVIQGRVDFDSYAAPEAPIGEHL